MSDYSGYVAPAPTFAVGDALRYGWNKFKNNAGLWIAVTLGAIIVNVAIQLPTGGLNPYLDFVDASVGPTRPSLLLSAVTTLVSFLLGVLLQAAFVQGSINEVDGRKPDFASFLMVRNLGIVVLAAIIVGVVTVIGLVLCIIPGIVISFLTYFTLQFVIDRDQDAVTAIKSSYQLTSRNVGQLLLLALACIGINLLAAIPCLLGLLVTAPVTLIASTYAYRVLVRGPVSPA